VTGILRLFFTQADRFDLVVLDAEQGQRTLDGFGTLLAERQVVFAAAALVGIALDQHLEALVGGQVLGVGGDQILVLVLDFVLVEVEVDAALRQLAGRIGQFARQAAGIEAAGGDRGHAGGGPLRDSTGAPAPSSGSGVVEQAASRADSRAGISSFFTKFSGANY
jgi:hypothetical protein